jgi:hypothetical protein
MQCPYCKQEHPDEAVFCPKTGQRFDAISQCKQCQAQLQPAWNICPTCGAPVEKVVQAPADPPQKKSKRVAVCGSLFLALLAGSACILVSVAVIAFFDPFNFNLLGRLSGRYDAAATAMPETTELYLGVNLLRTPLWEIRRLSPEIGQFLSLSLDSNSTGFVHSPPFTSGEYSASLSVPGRNSPAVPNVSGLEFMAALESDYALDLPKDLLPWIGQYIGVGVLGFSEDQDGYSVPRFVIAAEARDRQAADRFLEKLSAGASSNPGESIDRLNYRGIEIYIQTGPEKDQKLAFARSGSMVLIALDEQTLKDAIDSQQRNSLADSQVFSELAGKMPSNRFLSLYISRDMLDSLTLQAGPTAQLAGWSLLPATNLDAWSGSMMTLNIRDSQLQIGVFNLVDRSSLSNQDRRFISNPGSPGKTTEMVPAETLFYVSGVRPDYMWSAFNEVLSETNDQDEIKSSVVTVEKFLNIDLNRELFAYLDGEWTLAVYKSPDTVWSEWSDLEIGYNFIAQTTNENALSQTVRRPMTQIPFWSRDQILVSNLNDSPFYELYTDSHNHPEFIFGVTDGYFILGSNKDRIEDLFDQRKSLASTRSYQNLIRSLPDGAAPVLYVDVKETLTIIRSQLTPADLRSFNQSAGFLDAFTSILGVAYPLEEDIIRSVYYINLSQ